ncbi:hypothetical protein GCM10023149_46440 [Mucilaginibacter gynuensis]|uniref:TonB-dependent receptor plug domain-containing protein n=1 Tax=Mucilaginibacter gynuensis TaxID=1302236 RepID=A0ABP8HBY0_9SPHI
MMRRLIVIIFLFCSVSVFAQSADTVIIDPADTHVSDTTKRIRLISKSSLSNNKEPLYMVDGIEVSSDTFKVLQPDNIERIEILKDASATAIYGVKGANGVILVTTKNTRVDSIRSPKGLPSSDDIVYMLDGELSDKKLKKIDPKDVLSIVTIKKDDCEICATSNKNIDSIVVAITIPYGVTRYKSNLSKFSKQYKKYLADHKNDDNMLIYILNGAIVHQKKQQGIKTLFELYSKNIERINFSAASPKVSGQKPAMLFITTKK